MSTVTIHTRSFQFGLAIIRCWKILPATQRINLGSQLIRAGTSIGANVVEAQHAASKKEFSHYLTIALRSSRETEYWLALLKEAGILDPETVNPLLDENHQLSSILAAIILKSKKNEVI